MSKQNDMQEITKAKGRPMLTWVGKKPLERVEYYPAQEKEVYGDKSSSEFNKLFWGDNLQVLSHLLKDYRGKIDLIYIDPPFDSKADYVKKVKIRGEKTAGNSYSLLEEKQYSDIWENDEYLQFMYERLIIIKELLSERGTLYLHCDETKSHHLRCILDEVMGENNFLNEVIWCFRERGISISNWNAKHNNIFVYASKKGSHIFNTNEVRDVYSEETKKKFKYKDDDGWYQIRGKNVTGSPIRQADGLRPEHEIKYPGLTYRQYSQDGQLPLDWWEVSLVNKAAKERTSYPTQKPEELLEKIIKASSNEGSIVLDSFCGSGTTLAAAQKLGRKWIGCDINIGAIQTTTKRLVQIVEDQQEENTKLIKDDFKGLLGFKILNVNDYDIFKNEIEAKEIVMDMYGIEPIKRSSFDGTLDNNFVKVMPLNRVLNKLDIKSVLKSIEDSIDAFVAKPTSKAGEEIYEEGVMIIASGAELDAEDFLKKENKTGVKVVIRDILNDKKNLIFKKKPEARIEVIVKDNKLSVAIKEFYSPILMRKLELENEKMIDKKEQAKVEDFKQIIDSVAIDVDYEGTLFNAEIIDLPTKKELVKTEYSYTYPKKGKNTVAIKIVDVLGEEYFETFEIEA
jgi:DNA modification methylase